MTSFSPADWLHECEELNVELRQLELDLTGPLTARKRNQAINQSTACKNRLIELEKSLQSHSTGKSRLNPREVEKRQSLLSTNQSIYQRVDGLIVSTEPSSLARSRRRNELFEQSNNQSTSNGSLDHLSNQQLYQNHQQALADQDSQLDSILTGVKTLKVLSEDMSGELDLQSNLLNDLDGHIDQTHQTINRSTQRIQMITRKSATSCAAISCMILWIVLFVLLIATDIFCPLFALMGSHCQGHNSHEQANSSSFLGSKGS